MVVLQGNVGRRSIVIVVAAVTAVTALAGCSKDDPAASAAAASTGPACVAKAGFANHVGLAAGAVRTYVWKPFSNGAFKEGSKTRTAAMTTAAAASRLAASELEAAMPLVADCGAAKRLVNALTTGQSLAKAAGDQFAKSAPNTETLAGSNSIVTTVLDEAKALGIAVTPIDPTAAQLQG